MLILSSRAAAPRDQNDLSEIAEVLLSKEELSGNSSLLNKYIELLCNYFNVNYAVPVSSGTAAIQCALAALGVDKEDEVIVPVTGAVMSAVPIIALGATPVFVDCEEESFAISIKSLETKITSKTKCIISVPMWGYPAYNSKLHKISHDYNIPVIEDAAQAIGTLNNGKFEGTNTEIGCFSTHELKLISTGEGGFILTNDKIIAEKCRTYSKIGFNSSNVLEANYGVHMGLNYKLNAITSALGCSQVKKLNKRLCIREKNAELWLKHLADCFYLKHIFVNKKGYKPNYYGLVLLLNKEIIKANLDFSSILYDNGISTDTYRYKYQMLCNYPLFKKYYHKEEELMNKDFINAFCLIPRLVILPTHEDLNEDIIQKGAAIIKKTIDDICNINF